MAGREILAGVLEEMTIEDVRSLAPNVGVIPIGSTEPHGPALPYGSDTFRVQEVAYKATGRANSAGARVICLPAQPISLNNNFHRFPFACRVSVPVFMGLLRDLVRLMLKEGVKRILVLNNHGGNPDVIKAVQRDMAETEGLFLGLSRVCDFVSPEAAALIVHESDHAGENETSENMYLRPELVRTEKLADFPRRYPGLSALRDGRVSFVRPWHLYLPEAAGGETRLASAEKGRRVIESAIENLALFLAELSTAPESPDFPY